MNRYQCSVWYTRQIPSACCRLSLNTSQKSVPNSISCYMDGTARKWIRFSLPSIFSKTGRIPAIFLIVPLTERMRELLGSKCRAKRFAKAGPMKEHVAPGSKSALYDLPSSTTVRYNRLSSSRMACAGATLAFFAVCFPCFFFSLNGRAPCTGGPSIGTSTGASWLINCAPDPSTLLNASELLYSLHR